MGGVEHQTTRIARLLTAQTLAAVAQKEAQTLDAVRGRLMALVDARPPAGQAQNLRSAHLLLGRHATEFNRAFLKHLLEGINVEITSLLPQARGVKKRPLGNDALDGMSFSLIDVAQVERVLLLDRQAQRFNSHYEASLEPLSRRLGVLFGKDGSFLSHNPFAPLSFLTAFGLAWDSGAWDGQATDDLIASLQPATWFDLAPLYIELDARLEAAGVAPERPIAIRHNAPVAGDSRSQEGQQPVRDQAAADAGSSAHRPPSGGGQSHTGGQSGGGAASAWATLAPIGQSIAAQARQFLQRLGVRSGTGANSSNPGAWPASGAGEPSAPAPVAAASPALMGFLGGLQAGASAQPVGLRVDAAVAANDNVLRQMRDRDEVRSAPELDRGTVDALAEVFDFVFADQAIPMQMKFIIGRLQIPVLKAAMIDRDFFLSDQHPARRLVDTLACASVAWTPEKGEADPLYVHIEQTVQRVLTEFEDDLTVFVDLLRDFTVFLFETEQQAQARVDPVAHVEHRGEVWDAALAHVDEVIHERLQALSTEHGVTPFLVPFITQQWREVMARAWVQKSTRESLFPQTVVTMEQLVWSIQPKTDGQERRKLVHILPDLVRQLNVGLDTIDWNGKPRATFTRRLIATHTMAIRLTQSMPLDTGSGALETRDGEQAMRQLDARRAARQRGAEDRFDAQAQTFQRGMWFDVAIDTAVRVRCRLSWVSPLRTRLLFTNRDGFDAFVRSQREVAAMLRQGRLQVMDAQPIVGRAIDKILVDAESALAA